MCGIIGYAGRRPAVPYLIDGLGRLEYRGYDSAGIAAVGNNSIITVKAEGKLENLKNLIGSQEENLSPTGIGHTRWATHGAPTKENAHPHLSSDGVFAVVHNGIIENYALLKQELRKKGFSFASETDTEVVSQLLSFFYKGDVLSAIKNTCRKIQGTYALCILCRDFPDKIFCIRHSSPLTVGISNNGTLVASDPLAFCGLCSEIYRPSDGITAVISKKGADFFDRDMKSVSVEKEKLVQTTCSADKKGFPHYMLKEIHEQPVAVKNTITPLIRQNEIFLEGIPLTEAYVNSLRGIYIVACGSAYHVGMCGKYIIEELTGIPVHTDIASEFRYRNPPLGKNDLCIIISQSGETADSIGALKKAKEKGCLTVGIVNAPESTITRLSDFVIYTKAGPEIAVATTKAYSAQLSLMYCLGIYLARLRGKITPEKERELVRFMNELPQKIRQTVLHSAPYVKELSQILKNSEHAYFIGRGTDCAIAAEGSLKLKEISYIHSEYYGAGELKHGTISLIEKDTVAVSVMTKEELFEKTLSNALEIKARGGTVIAVTTDKLKSKTDCLDYTISVPDCHSLFLPSLAVIPLQLLSYCTAEKRGCDIDKPRNLAKSVTVE